MQTFHDLKMAFERNFQEKIHRVTEKMLLETCQKEGESAKDYVERWWSLAMECTDLSPQAAHDIFVRNMQTKYQKYFVAVTPKLYAKIVEIAQSAEAVIAREA